MTGRGTMQVGQFRRPTLSKDGRTSTVHIPMTMRHQGGRKQVVTPAGATPWIPIPPRVNNTLVKALVRAHRWRDMLESGNYATVRDLAKAEAIDEVYLGRVMPALCPFRTHAPQPSKQCLLYRRTQAFDRL